MRSLRLLPIAVAVGFATSCAPQPLGAAPSASVPPTGIDPDTLREARWRPLAEAASDGKEVIRVASVLGLVERVYIEIEKSGSEVTLELADAAGNRMKRSLPPDIWTRIASRAQVLRIPIDEKKADRHYQWIIKHTGYCHGWDQIETALAGEHRYVATSVCLGDAARDRWAFAQDVVKAALALFPECGSALRGEEMERLFLCPSGQSKKDKALSTPRPQPPGSLFDACRFPVDSLPTPLVSESRLL